MVMLISLCIFYTFYQGGIMPLLVLPGNDNARLGFLKSTQNADQKDTAEGRTYVYSETMEQVNSFVPVFGESLSREAARLSVRSKEVEEKNSAYSEMMTYLRDGVEVLRRMVYRLKLPAQTFQLYGMPLDGKTPEFGTQAEAFEFVDQFVNGDIESGKLGNPQIACPTTQEIKGKKDIAKKEYDDVVVADRAYAEVEKELAGLRLTADENIQDVIADLRRSLRKLTPPAQRRIMMSYGARFKFLPGEPEELPEAASVVKEPAAAGT
jgi:hypothetical protein